MAQYALCVGINAYGHDSDLSGCVNDCNDNEAVLVSRGFTVTKLIDAEATGAHIKNELGDMITHAVSGDVIVFTYSGHGTNVPDKDMDEQDQRDEAICPVDLWSNGVLVDDDLWDIYAKHKPGVHLLIISDSCFSGTVSRFVPISPVRGAPARKVRFLPPSMFLQPKELEKLATHRRTVRFGQYAGLLMGGCSDDEYSWDAYFGGRPNGAFTYVALDTLKNMPANATYKHWYTHIRAVLPSQEYPQTPSLYGSSTQKRWNILK